MLCINVTPADVGSAATAGAGMGKGVGGCWTRS